MSIYSIRRKIKVVAKLGARKMLNNKHIKDWSCIVSEHMGHLSLPQAIGLATWSFGMVMTRSSSLTQVSNFIAKVNGEKALSS
ncbi:hypothetical protein CK510_21450 [Brunnivagina elsteri CCALA 953]|uniref:Uncharacterized protein n=2 Tax=Brunnivagina TaxID=3344733 RepID=A0A2A2TE60_9CYAN|nr:hypothetical protein CK510_21450 [Calothrix elsteri CCALA 953]